MSVRHGKSVPRSLAVLSIITLAFFVAGTAQQSSQQPPLKYEVSVTLKLVQVCVTDKSGKPVRDLTKDEFKLTDNGKPVILSAFERHDLAAAPTTGVEAPAPELVPAPGPAAAPNLNRKFIILFDFAYNTGHGIVAGVEAARHFLDMETRPEDELAFVSYSMLKGLRVHEFLTTDHAKIKAALAKITSKDIACRADEIEQAYWQVADTSGEIKEDQPRRRGPDPLNGPGATQFHAADGEIFQGPDRVRPSPSIGPRAKERAFLLHGVPSSLINATRSGGTDQEDLENRFGAMDVDGDRLPDRRFHTPAASGSDAEGVCHFELLLLCLRHQGVVQAAGPFRL